MRVLPEAKGRNGQHKYSKSCEESPSEALVIGNAQDQRQVHKAVVGVLVPTTPAMLPEPSNCKHPENKCYIVHALNWCFSTLEESDQQRFAHCGIALASQSTWQNRSLRISWPSASTASYESVQGKQLSEAKKS